MAAHAQSIRRLYAAEPPAGSTFVRIVNRESEAARVSIGSGATSVISSVADIATPYVVTPGGKKLTIKVDGADLPVGEIPAAETFVTLVLSKSFNKYAVASIVDTPDKSVGLNAEIIFYNLGTECAGTLTVADGPVVFDGVAAGTSRQRAINPVDASLTASCGGTMSPRLKLPALKAGDYYSVFLVSSAAGPKLVGALDQTAPYQDDVH